MENIKKELCNLRAQIKKLEEEALSTRNQAEANNLSLVAGALEITYNNLKKAYFKDLEELIDKGVI